MEPEAWFRALIYPYIVLPLSVWSGNRSFACDGTLFSTSFGWTTPVFPTPCSSLAGPSDMFSRLPARPSAPMRCCLLGLRWCRLMVIPGPGALCAGRIPPLQHHHLALANGHGTGRDGLLKTTRFGKVNITKPFLLIDLHLQHRAEDGEGGLQESFGDPLGRIGMLEECLSGRRGGSWLGPGQFGGFGDRIRRRSYSRRGLIPWVR